MAKVWAKIYVVHLHILFRMFGIAVEIQRENHIEYSNFHCNKERKCIEIETYKKSLWLDFLISKTSPQSTQFKIQPIQSKNAKICSIQEQCSASNVHNSEETLWKESNLKALYDKHSRSSSSSLLTSLLLHSTLAGLKSSYRNVGAGGKCSGSHTFSEIMVDFPTP